MFDLLMMGNLYLSEFVVSYPFLERSVRTSASDRRRYTSLLEFEDKGR